MNFELLEIEEHIWILLLILLQNDHDAIKILGEKDGGKMVYCGLSKIK
jgi:hypothetical protein